MHQYQSTRVGDPAEGANVNDPKPASPGLFQEHAKVNRVCLSYPPQECIHLI